MRINPNSKSLLFHIGLIINAIAQSPDDIVRNWMSADGTRTV